MKKIKVLFYLVQWSLLQNNTALIVSAYDKSDEFQTEDILSSNMYMFAGSGIVGHVLLGLGNLDLDSTVKLLPSFTHSEPFDVWLLLLLILVLHWHLTCYPLCASPFVSDLSQTCAPLGRSMFTMTATSDQTLFIYGGLGVNGNTLSKSGLQTSVFHISAVDSKSLCIQMHKSQLLSFIIMKVKQYLCNSIIKSKDVCDIVESSYCLHPSQMTPGSITLWEESGPGWRTHTKTSPGNEFKAHNPCCTLLLT